MNLLNSFLSLRACRLAIAVSATTVGAQTTLSIVDSASGRVGHESLAGTDWDWGSGDAETAATDDPGSTQDFWSNSSNLVGDNPNNTEFGQIWRFDVTQNFIDDVNGGYNVFLEFSSLTINNGGGAPSLIEVSFITRENSNRVTAAGTAKTESLDFISGSAENTSYSLQVTSLGTISGGLLEGDRLWFGLNSGISTNGTANNINFDKSNAELVTVIPEPGRACSPAAASPLRNGS